MLHPSHLFFLLIPVLILLGTLWSVLTLANDHATTYRELRRRSLHCWIAGIVGIGMATPFIVVSYIAFT